MKILNSKWGKFLVLTPVMFLIINTLYFMYAVKEIRQTLLKEKYIEVVNIVDMLSAAVEANPERHWSEHEQNIKDSIEYFDTLPQIFAAAYKVIDGELIIFTKRVYETSPLEPLERPEFIEAVFSNEQGSIVIGDTPENQQYRDVYLYYRWMPIYSAPNERYLIVTGVSYYSVSSAVPLWVSVGQWVSMGITFAINTGLIILLVRLGYIYESRQGDKWRKRGRHYE